MAGGIIIPDVAKRREIQGFYTPKDGIRRNFYWDPDKGGEVRLLDDQAPPLRMHHRDAKQEPRIVVGSGANAKPRSIAIGSSATCSKDDSVAVGASSVEFAIDNAERRIASILDRPMAIDASPPVDSKRVSLYFDSTRNSLMAYDGVRHTPVPSAIPAHQTITAWCVAPCRTCGAQVRSFREPTDTRPIYCGDCPNPHNVGGAKCLIEGCRIGIFEDEVFCSRCVKDPVGWSTLFAGIVGVLLAIRGMTLVLSVPLHLQVFYMAGMLLIGFKTCGMILKGVRGR